MDTVHTLTSYTFILTEDEWYSATEQQKEAWQNQIKREGKEAECRYLAILVKPDTVMSISPIPRQHRVWGFTFPLAAEEAFLAEILEICHTKHSGLTKAEKRVLLRKAFDNL